MPQGWPFAIAGLLPGINEAEAGARLPAPTPETWVAHPLVSYGADIPVSQDYIGIGNEVRYTRPPLKARYAWFDFFRSDYEWIVHVDWGDSGQPDTDYLRNRIARLTFDLRTAEAQIERPPAAWCG